MNQHTEGGPGAVAPMSRKERAKLATWLRPRIARAGRRFERLRRLDDDQLIAKAARALFEGPFQVTAEQIMLAMMKKLAARRSAAAAPMIIYGIRSQDSDVLGYVGISTKKPGDRLVDHIATAKTAIARRESTIFQDWLVRDRSVKVVTVLEKVKRAHEPRARERHWIKKLIAQGIPLLNTMDAPAPPGKFRCRTFPCTKVTFSSRRSADVHAKNHPNHQVEKCSLAEFPFALDPDAPPDVAFVKRQGQRLYYKGVACNECGEVIPGRAFLGESSAFDEDGAPYRVCTGCEYDDAFFESTDESGYDFVSAD